MSRTKFHLTDNVKYNSHDHSLDVRFEPLTPEQETLIKDFYAGFDFDRYEQQIAREDFDSLLKRQARRFCFRE